MSGKYNSSTSIIIKVSADKVWQALTDPALIKEYLFGTNAKSDWKKGSDLIYEGIWEGKEYQDKGKIIDIIPEKKLHTTYYSKLSGKEDKPENYNNVIYTLDEIPEGTKLTIFQDNIESQESADHSKKNWEMVLQSMKKLLET